MFSLEGSIRTCKIDTAWANRMQTDRFFNPDNMICPVWNGLDTYGRPVQPDSFFTKNGGCNSAEDRILVENVVGRPLYFEYVTLDASGLTGDLYNSHYADEVAATSDVKNIQRITGNPGIDYRANVANRCGYNRYDDAQSQMNQEQRRQQSTKQGYMANMNRTRSGMN